MRLKRATENISNGVAQRVNIRDGQTETALFTQQNEVREQASQIFALSVKLLQNPHNCLIVTKQLDMFPRQLITQERKGKVDSPQFLQIYVLIRPSWCPTVGN